MMEGGCFCGAVRYTVSGPPFDSCICHCTDCRRMAAAPAVAWFAVQTADVRFAGRAARFASSPGVTRNFCPACSSMLTYARDDVAGEMDIATASLDEPDRVPPTYHVWVARKPAWAVIGDGLPQYPRSRREG